MKLVSSLIASCLAFTYAQNDTSTTPVPTDMSTTMYTTQSIVYVSKVYDPDLDPTNNFDDCEYFWMGSFKDDSVELSICGYTEDYMGYTDIKLVLPSKRWVAFGMSSSGSVSDTDTFTNYDGYNVIIPLAIQSDEIMERYYKADKTFTDLASTFEIISDAIDDVTYKRTIRLMRPMTVSNASYDNATLTDEEIGMYFDYEGFSACDDEARISVTFGPTDDKRFVAEDSFTQETYGNREAVEATVEEEADALCDEDPEDGDDASNMMVFGALIIGFIFTLLQS